jgi:hypothetical protein
LGPGKHIFQGTLITDETPYVITDDGLIWTTDFDDALQNARFPSFPTPMIPQNGRLYVFETQRRPTLFNPVNKKCIRALERIIHHTGIVWQFSPDLIDIVRKMGTYDGLIDMTKNRVGFFSGDILLKVGSLRYAELKQSKEMIQLLKTEKERIITIIARNLHYHRPTLENIQFEYEDCPDMTALEQEARQFPLQEYEKFCGETMQRYVFRMQRNYKNASQNTNPNGWDIRNAYRYAEQFLIVPGCMTKLL